MIIVVNHKINNPTNFWASAQESLPKLPESGVRRVVAVLPNTDMTESTCIWEADSIEVLNAYLRRTVGDWSIDAFHEVNSDNAQGLSL